MSNPPNVVILVVDTLREDFSAGLKELLSYGFVKYTRAIAAAPGSLESHVSMFTGELPSVHGVHDSTGLADPGLMRVSREVLAQSKSSILSIAKENGYTTYCASASPYVSPQFGFMFDHYRGFDNAGMTDLLEVSLKNMNVVRAFLQARKQDILFAKIRRLLYRLVSRLIAPLGMEQMEKGSKYIVRYLDRVRFHEPFFAFVNLLEAHDPYHWGEQNERFVFASIIGKEKIADWWRDCYPVHARLGIRRALEIISKLVRYNPLIIVTSDHGQLLGEGGKFGHGFALNTELLEVPLYIRVPDGRRTFQQTGAFISLTELPSIVRLVLTDGPYQIGGDVAFAESWGGHVDAASYAVAANEGRTDWIFAHRIRVFTKGGSFLFNKDTKEVEELTGSLTQTEISGLMSVIPIGANRPVASLRSPVTKRDEKILLDRLRELGYA